MSADDLRWSPSVRTPTCRYCARICPTSMTFRPRAEQVCPQCEEDHAIRSSRESGGLHPIL